MDRKSKLLLPALAIAALATVSVSSGRIPPIARWILLVLPGWYWIRPIIMHVEAIKRTKVLNAFAVTWWVNSFPILPAIMGAGFLWGDVPFEKRIWGLLFFFILVSTLAEHTTIIRYNHKLKKSKQ